MVCRGLSIGVPNVACVNLGNGHGTCHHPCIMSPLRNSVKLKKYNDNLMSSAVADPGFQKERRGVFIGNFQKNGFCAESYI